MKAGDRAIAAFLHFAAIARCLHSGNSKLKLQLVVAVVAEGRILAVLAAAEIHGLGLRGFKLHRREVGAFVAAIAEGLIGALPAGAPEIAFAGFDFHRIGTLLGDFWF